MLITLRITCKPIGDFNLKIQLAAYVSELKEEIRQMRQIPCDKQMLTFNGLVLEESYPLEAYGITDGSVVTLSLPAELPVALNIDIRLPSGKLANLLSTHKDTVYSLKRQLQRLHGCLIGRRSNFGSMWTD
uniref:Ubiquitin-like domain-containing protein n=1 Tax=Schistocephalus solidus TaxID=70667 RepID=A0A0X3PJ77_SCHSO